MFGYVNALYECITSHGGVESATAHSACAPQMEEAKDWLDTTARVSLSATVPEVAETFGFRGDDVDRYLIRLADAVKEVRTLPLFAAREAALRRPACCLAKRCIYYHRSHLPDVRATCGVRMCVLVVADRPRSPGVGL